MRGIIDTATTGTSGKLTLEDLMRTYEAARRIPAPHVHLIAASAKPGSVVLCADCGSAVRVPDTWGA